MNSLTFPTEIMQMLKNADIHLILAKAEKLWAAHSAEFVEAISYVDDPMTASFPIHRVVKVI
ncbi:hypothetical protein [Brasilonema sp. UFV-L1]|uniref:hypothetical protein n=1 Tax=Brasilonema sp. UFV-L1 TaxID=2234130 RepID=UPI00145E3190|nr:hypothetical protein [Brasilonema sp. UFV-L1]NMG11192.1 hypothetical protein [Brasilonema sp. UFV-L1]